VVIHNLLPSGSLRVQGLTLIGEGTSHWPVSLAGGGDVALIHRSDVKLYRDDRPLPRAYVVPRAIIAEGLDAALETLRSDGHDARDAAVLERAPFEPPPSAGLRGLLRRVRDAAFAALGIDRQRVPGAIAAGAALPILAPTATLDERPSVQWVEDDPERIVLRVTAPQGGLLVLRDTFYPGWSATVDGQPVTPLRADVLFRAVPLPAGSREPHEVAFTYRSLPFERGALVSLLTLAVTLAIAIAPYPPVLRMGAARAP
jgi:hypothetical protein